MCLLVIGRQLEPSEARLSASWGLMPSSRQSGSKASACRYQPRRARNGPSGTHSSPFSAKAQAPKIGTGEATLVRNKEGTAFATRLRGRHGGLIGQDKVAVDCKDFRSFLREAQHRRAGIADPRAGALPGTDDTAIFSCKAHHACPVRAHRTARL
jgi:hypothetical protein